MQNLGTFTFKKGFLVVKSRVLNLNNFAKKLELGEVKGNKIAMPNDDAKYKEVRDILLQAGYSFV